MPKYILAFDAGTTSSRAILFDEKATPISISQKEFEQIFPRPGWVEHNPEEIWKSQLWAAKDCVRKSGVDAKDIAAIGITNQRETTLLWDRKTGQPVGNAIVWQDRRTAGFCDSLKKEGWEELIREKTGLVIDAYFSATKLQWILKDEKIRKRAENGELAFGTVDTWIVWKLTGGRRHITDFTNASRTLLFNIKEHCWDHHLLKIFDIPEAVLPEVKPSAEIFGTTEKKWLGEEIPIAGVLGDQQSALLGQLCTEPGMVKNTYGTGSFAVMNTGSHIIHSKNQMLSTIAWNIDGHISYALEGSIFITGAVVQWLRDQMRVIRNASEIEDLALQVEDNGGVYFVPAFAGLGAPHWDQYARGMMIGITRGTQPAHIARAALESIAFQSYDVIKAMEEDAGHKIVELRVDGGACVNNLLMQFQADILETEVIRPKLTEITSLGAAFAAGLAIGIWKDFPALKSTWEAERKFVPGMEYPEILSRTRNWERAVERTLNWEN